MGVIKGKDIVDTSVGLLKLDSTLKESIASIDTKATRLYYSRQLQSTIITVGSTEPIISINNFQKNGSYRVTATIPIRANPSNTFESINDIYADTGIYFNVNDSVKVTKGVQLKRTQEYDELIVESVLDLSQNDSVSISIYARTVQVDVSGHVYAYIVIQD